MLIQRIGIFLLLAFLLWRGSNSAYVLWTDTRLTDGWEEGLTASDERRISRAVILPPDKPSTPVEKLHHYQRYKLLEKHVDANSHVFFLHEYKGPAAVYEVFSFFRLGALIYPRDAQMVNRPPARPHPDSIRPWSRDRYVLDIRNRKRPLGDGFRKIASSPGAVLWKQVAEHP